MLLAQITATNLCLSDVDTTISRKARVGLLFAMAGIVTNLGQAVGQGLSLNALAWVG